MVWCTPAPLRFALAFTILGGVSALAQGDFVRREGRQLVQHGRPVQLRGVNFQTDHLVRTSGEWTRDAADEGARPVTDWYTEAHVRRVQEIGFNTIRILLNYRFFESDARPGEYDPAGFEFLDRHVAWADQHGLHVILDLHDTPGGLQYLGQGGALWDDQVLRDRVVRLWRAIALRYRDEPRIAAYDLLNEPFPYRPEQWSDLAARIVSAIREVDPNHLLLVEQVSWLLEPPGEWSLELARRFQVTVEDPNVIYDVHFYDPTRFTFQGTPAAPAGAGGGYPDQGIRERAADGRMLPRDRTFLEHQLTVRLLDFARERSVPVHVGEWGPVDTTLTSDGGGFEYLRDVIDLFDRHGVHWCYYSVNELHTDGTLERIHPDRERFFREYFGR